LFVGGVKAAAERGERVRLVTLTAPPGGMSLPEVYDGWKRVSANLRKRGILREYAGVVELQERQAPHLHVLTTGEFLKQPELSRIAQGRRGSRGRFGPVADIREVRGTGPRSLVGGYLLKQVGGEMAAYVAKAKAGERASLRAVGGGRYTRPVRSSRGWYPGGLAAAAEVVKAEWSPALTIARPAVADWHLWRVDQGSGEVRPIKALSAAPEPILTPLAAPVVLAPEVGLIAA
jgi:hypothetical protein